MKADTRRLECHQEMQTLAGGDLDTPMVSHLQQRSPCLKGPIYIDKHVDNSST